MGKVKEIDNENKNNNKNAINNEKAKSKLESQIYVECGVGDNVNMFRHIDLSGIN